MTNVTPIRPNGETPEVPQPRRKTRTAVTETKLLTADDLRSWQIPPVQGIFKVNKKVLGYIEDLKESGGIIGGVITLGRLPNDPRLWIVDGLHRTSGALVTELLEFIAEVRIIDFPNMGELADEYVKMNTPFRGKRPDDILRAMEENLPCLKLLRAQCDFIGYGNVRRAVTGSPVIGMSQVLKCWFGSKQETPGTSGGINPRGLAEQIDEKDIEQLSAFLNTVYAAWGNDPEYYRLWGALNLTMCMWIYHQLVLKKDIRRKVVMLTVAEFGRCMMSVSAASDYVDWVRGRNMSERDRSPCYTRLRKIMGARITDDTGRRAMFPQPSWCKN